eukprot:GEMP01003439.1.p1 GENE.GEMP01003439.1~~GEMP01003439.1.p1  ORF type:complete len:589 (+),score=163.39 GEMP01003439.1:26-1768(+)
MGRAHVLLNESLRTATAREALHLVQSRGNEMNLLNLLTALGKVEDIGVIAQWLPGPDVREAPTRWLCRGVYLLGKRGYAGSTNPFMTELSRRLVDAEDRSFTPQDVTQTAWGLTKLTLPVCDALKRRFTAFPGDDMAAVDACNMLWALARAPEATAPGLARDHAFEIVKRHWDKLRDKEIASCLWAAELCAHPFLQWVASRPLPENIWRFGQPPELSQVCWALRNATGPAVDEAFRKVGASLSQSLWQSPKDLATAIYAFADASHLPLVRCLQSDECIGRLKASRDAQTRANAMLSYARCALSRPVVALAAHNEIPYGALKTQHVANMLYALASVEKVPSRTFSRLADLAVEMNLRAEEHAMVLWAFATLDMRASTTHVRTLCAKKYPSTGMREYALGAWARSVLGVRPDYDFTTWVMDQRWDARWLSQLHVAFTAFPPMDGEAGEGVVEMWRRAAENAFRSTQDSRGGDYVHRRVVKAIGSHLVRTEYELPVAGYLVVDIAFIAQKVAIEVDGPSHFWEDIGEEDEVQYRLKGSSALKQRLLERAGWSVLRVPVGEMDNLDDEQIRGYIAARWHGTTST